MVLVFSGAVLCSPAVAAQQPSSGGQDIDGPPPPVAPAVINRDAQGRATVRATRLIAPLQIDGRLDEDVYSMVPAMSGFIQNDPREGEPADENTEVWIFYDENNFYIVGRCWESEPERMIANEMRRDSMNIVQNDQLAWGLDTFYDRRNMYIFEVSAAGGRIDGQVTNERQVSLDWNPVWNVRTSRFDRGYVVEAAIPFKSLRYRAGTNQVWGLQVRRTNRWRNQRSYLTPIPASVGSQGHFRASLAATIVGIEVPGASANLEIKPYATSSVTTDRTVAPAVDNDPGGDIGVDLKYGLTQSVTADFTVNTDFAQVEADEQQINLTRFSLFFPEKREFFLENAGTFSFGATTTTAGAAGDAPLLFYSRQIGLYQGREVPILAGSRVNGRVGPFVIGLLNVQSKEAETIGARAANFSVVRIKRDVLEKSSIGMIFTNRSVAESGTGGNQAYGLDGTFAFYDDLAINAYWAQTKTDGQSGDNVSYRTQANYAGDRYGVEVEHLLVGRNFDPQVGFVRRRDMRKNYGQFRFSPRPANSAVVRKYSWTGTFTRIDDTAGHLESQSLAGRFELQLQNSDLFFIQYTDEHESLPVPFRIGSDVTLPVGDYDFSNGEVGYNFGRQHVVSGNLSVQYGTFYNGYKTTYSVSSGRFTVGPQISVEPSVSINRVDLTQGNFTTTLISSRATYTMTPWMFASALVQYNSDTHSVATNVRFRWEYQPGSELFIVYNEQRDTLTPSFPDIANRAFIVKINRLFRF